MEDSVKVHKGFAKGPRAVKRILGFDWPPSTLDLNLIEKVW